MSKQLIQGVKPGLFITGTDTGVGKTMIACAMAAALRRQAPGIRLGVSKPFATGCRHDREGLVNEDAEALAHFADCRQPLEVINPIRFVAPLAPAVAAQESGDAVDWSSLARSLALLQRESDALLIEGVGGLMVPLDPDHPKYTVLDLIQALGYPVVIVTRASLGTLNHTAMTARLLKHAGCQVAGLVVNRYVADPAKTDDPSIAGNRIWLERLTGVKTLGVVPNVDPIGAQPQRGRIDPAVLEALETTYWPDILQPPRVPTARKHIDR
jgi:dethiobiotin synthetase